MKVGKRLTAFFLAGMLILTSNVTGFAEETTADQQPEEAKSTYLLTVDAEDSTVTVKGDHVEQKTASTYQIEVRSEVAASITPADGKEVKEVRVNKEQMDLADGTVAFSMPEKDSLLQVILKEKEQAAEETEEPKQEVTQTEEWELPDEKEYQQRLQLAKALGVEDWLDEEGWLDDGYFAGKSDLELTESGVVPLIRNSITNPKMSRAVGNALHKNPDPENIPCFRVVNSKGELSGAFAFGGENEQARRLMADGVEVVNGKVDLKKYGI